MDDANAHPPNNRHGRHAERQGGRNLGHAHGPRCGQHIGELACMPQDFVRSLQYYAHRHGRRAYGVNAHHVDSPRDPHASQQHGHSLYRVGGYGYRAGDKCVP